MSVGLSITTIREALRDQIIAGVGREIVVHAAPTGTQATSPTCTVEYQNNPIDYWVTFGAAGLATLRLELVVEPGGADATTASTRLDQFLSVGTGNGWSIVDAVMSDRTLGLGAGVDVIVDNVSIDGDLVAHFFVTVNISKQGAST